ncbi:hypothetical protein B484DRAFT_449232 [Ochromonadaceae sp. CCMP2298]|nr:hypothetical protein B484DRAFT_449232 [Ochromonadaceae sp. CCMP2298]|mmetsp:Transcript_21923/g.48722  ORF Transcript_21923/g.48722 Transcript_21923/m.48722 type:complete len:243 (-) Transcript_21923:145-873(-)|eukprot:CAMPEP_0173190720 /NCGR_PEP_ID=MMETSP1141-20130122/12493_1 /TAXON_ID=483371 /ORGANISM="non described non described, Strain CCMP2298" /LENGTH=242 /DNA_ID=CAMNT_0014114843 /DNA_START=142 /DNA_END=870 /DNA_ORIENTATION=+
MEQDYVDVPLQKGSIVRKDLGRACHVYLDVTVLQGNGPSLDSLIFQNHYCAALTVAQAEDRSPYGYTTLLDQFPLMRSAHTEEQAQTWVAISAKQLGPKYRPGRPLRLTLLQPSPAWKLFEIRGLRAVGKRSPTEGAAKALAQMSLSGGGGDFGGRLGFAQRVQQMLNADLLLLSQAAQLQSFWVASPDVDLRVVADFKKSAKKKEKKKDKKAAAVDKVAGIAAAEDPTGPGGLDSDTIDIV